MLENILLAVLPTVAGCTVTYFLSKREKKRKINSKYCENNFFKFTRWLRGNFFKLYELLMFIAAWTTLYMILKYLLNYPLPNIMYELSLILLAVLFIYTLLVEIDVLFNKEGKK